MGYSKTVIILPGYGLDSLPYDIDDEQAAGLLNAFAAACHPRVLAAIGELPAWASCDEHADCDPGTLFVIPPISEDHIHGVWVEEESDSSPGIIRGITDRDELVDAMLARIETSSEKLDPELTADCMAIGIAHVLMEILTQQMHYFTNIDVEILGQQSVAAATAIIEGDTATAKDKLTIAYESLVEARERFYPVDCYLLDLCLANAEQANEHHETLLATRTPLNLLIDGNELPKFSTAAREAIRSKLQPPSPDEHAPVEVLGGEHNSIAAPLVPLADWLRDFSCGMEGFGATLGQRPTSWARKRFGFSPLLPQVLTAFGYKSALHFALDDGTFPDAEHSKMSWEGSDGTNIDAISRIPIAIESPTAFLKLPERIAEAMQDDMVAAILFARMPTVNTPWLSDFQRIQSYGDVFGRFVTFEEFATDSGDSGIQSRYEAREYVSPFLIQGSALGEQRPISRFIQMHQQQAALSSAIACRTMVRLIRSSEELDDQQSKLQQLATITNEQEPTTPETTQAIESFTTETLTSLAEICGCDTTKSDGLFVFNPLSFDRTITVELPNSAGTAVVKVPAFGFAWTDKPTRPEKPSSVPLATKSLMHNGLFEVHINEETGGIATIKGFARSPNRLSQQVGFRFENKVEAGRDENGDAIMTSYSSMKAREINVVRCDENVGEVQSIGDLIDPRDGSRMAAFRQRMSVVNQSPFVEVEIELTDVDHFPEGNPWLCYYGLRFAWNDAAAALTRSVFGQAHGFSGDRFESPHYLEIASDELRTTIVSHGAPFWRKTDMRMADSLLVVEGEQQRRFRFTIAIDQNYPQQAALHAMTPAMTIPCSQPKSGTSGWFARLSAKNVLITEFPQLAKSDSFSQTFRLLETEGRAVTTKLACVRPATTARKVDFRGNETQTLVVEPDGSVTIDIRKHELCNIQINF
jgi:alpha-mannosidase